jgi:hypothetical protein
MLDNHLDTEAEQEITEQEPEIDEPIQDEPEPVIIPEEYAEIIEALLTIYPEFKPILETQEQINNFIAIIDQVRCLYPEFNDLKKCQNKYPFLMLIAHYAVMAGLTKSIGIYAQNGLVASSSIDGVSVSYQSSPYSTKGDELTYYLSLTPYGLQYLAWLARQAGLKIVN